MLSSACAIIASDNDVNITAKPSHYVHLVHCYIVHVAMIVHGITVNYLAIYMVLKCTQIMH